MRIIECYIENFGKISKQKFEFNSGFNCISGDNGMGKTTLAAFIKAMLYGFNDTKKTNLEENDRKHYLPWQGGICGGSLTFSVGDKIYRIERSFAQKAADDTYALYDTATGRICTDFEDGLGEALFGIDADGFERTVFLSERALAPNSDNKSISAKLSDLVGCDGDIGCMDEAMKLLENQRKFYYKKGGSGVISDTQTRIDALTRRLDTLNETEAALDVAEREISDCRSRLEAAKKESAEIQRKREEISLKATVAGYEKQCKELKEGLDNAILLREKVSAVFGDKLPEFSDIDEASYKATEARNLLQGSEKIGGNERYKELSLKFEGRLEKADIDNVKSVLIRINEIKDKENTPELKMAKRIFCRRVPSEDEILDIQGLLSKKESFPLMLIGYLIFAVIGVLGIIINPLILIVCAVGIAATAVAHILLSVKAKKVKRERISDFFYSVSEAEVTDVNEAAERLADMLRLLPIISSADDSSELRGLTEYLTALSDLFDGCAIEKIISEYEEYSALSTAEKYINAEKNERLARAQKLKAEAEEFLKGFNTKTTDPFRELREALTEYNRLTAEIGAKQTELEKLEAQSRLDEDKRRIATAELSELEEKRGVNTALIEELSRELTLLERKANGYSEELESRDEYYMQRAELQDALKKHTDNYDTLLLTKKYLTIAKDNMTVKYLGKTKSGFLKYAEIIGGITGESFEMDTDFSVTKQEGATTRGVEAYSRGTRDLFNLAARLALVDSLYESEKPFIILDDPFTALDDGKTAAALRLLKEFSKDRQVIYFTCSESRSL